MTPHQLMSFCEAASRCELVSVRVNALAVLGITGSSLAKEKDTADTLQVILIVIKFRSYINQHLYSIVLPVQYPLHYASAINLFIFTFYNRVLFWHKENR